MATEAAPGQHRGRHTPGSNGRFRLVSGVLSTYASDESGTAWDLFADQNALTAEMTSAIDQRVKAVAAG